MRRQAFTTQVCKPGRPPLDENAEHASDQWGRFWLVHQFFDKAPEV